MFPTLKNSLIDASKSSGSHQDRANSYFLALLPFCQIVQNELIKISIAMPQDFPREFLSVKTQSFLSSDEDSHWNPFCIDNDYLYVNLETPEATISSIIKYLEYNPLTLNEKKNIEIQDFVLNSFHTICGVSQILQEIIAPKGNLSILKITSNSISISLEVQDHTGEGNVSFHSHN